jgi:hypothetical protein
MLQLDLVVQHKQEDKIQLSNLELLNLFQQAVVV